MKTPAIVLGGLLAILAGVSALMLFARERANTVQLAPSHPERRSDSGPDPSSLEQAPPAAEREPVAAPTTASADRRPEVHQTRVVEQTQHRKPKEEGSQAVAIENGDTELVFRLLGPDLQPLANQKILCQVTETRRGGMSIGGDSSETDEDGRSRFATELRRVSERTALAFTLEAHVPSGGLRAQLDLSPDLPRGCHDLGDIVLSRAQLLVAGRAIDARGDPLSSGFVNVEPAHKTIGRFSRLSRELGPDGTFAFFDDPPASALRLVVHSRGYVRSEPAAFTPGASGLLIQVADGGTIAGSIRPPEGTLVSDYRVDLEARDSWDSGGTFGIKPESDGSFASPAMSAGLYDAGVYFRSGEQLALIRGVEVEEGKTLRDPRLQGIDLSAVVRCVRLHVSIPDGNRVSLGTVCVLNEREAAPGRMRTWSRMGYAIKDGVAQLPLLEGPLDLAVIVPGFRILQLAGVDRDEEVVLREPAIEVRLVLPETVELPPPGARLKLKLTHVPGDAEGNDSWWQLESSDREHTFGERRELRLSLQMPGTYTLEFFLDGSSVDGAIPATRALTIDASAAGSVIPVEPDAEAYLRALAACR